MGRGGRIGVQVVWGVAAIIAPLDGGRRKAIINGDSRIVVTTTDTWGKATYRLQQTGEVRMELICSHRLSANARTDGAQVKLM